MIDIRPGDVAAQRTASNGRFVIFTTTDVRPGWPLAWWGVVLDTGGDGFGMLVRLDATAAPAGWTARQLIEVALARAVEEAVLTANPTTISAGEESAVPVAPAVRGLSVSPAALAASAAVVVSLSAAARAARRGEGGETAAPIVAFHSDGRPSEYSWAVASSDGFDLALCPDREGRAEGVGVEQLLIVLDQLLSDATRALPHAPWVWIARRHIAAALTAEMRRLAILANLNRGATGAPSDTTP